MQKYWYFAKVFISKWAMRARVWWIQKTEFACYVGCWQNQRPSLSLCMVTVVACYVWCWRNQRPSISVSLCIVLYDYDAIHNQNIESLPGGVCVCVCVRFWDVCSSVYVCVFVWCVHLCDVCSSMCVHMCACVRKSVCVCRQHFWWHPCEDSAESIHSQ